MGDPVTRSEVRKEVIDKFRQMVDESMNEIEASVKDAGLFDPQPRRARGPTKISKAPQRTRNEVFLWLAGYQTCGWSRTRLAEAVGVERNTVGMGIKRLAEELKIGLRPDRSHDMNQTVELIAERLQQARARERALEGIPEDDKVSKPQSPTSPRAASPDILSEKNPPVK